MSQISLTTLLRDNPVVVTGMGCFSAAGDSVEQLWSAAASGRGLGAWRDFGVNGASSRFVVCAAAELDGSDPRLHPVRKTDRCVQMAWLAADQAWRQARMAGAFSPSRIGVAVGSSRGPLGKVLESSQSVEQRRHLPTLAAHSTFASVSGALAQYFEIKGPGATISATCASAAFAIGFAAEQILLGKADAMLAGGAEAPLHPMILAPLHAAGVLGFHEDASRACRPFDATRDGFVAGEGSAFLVLESARSAARRGIEPLSKLAGWGMSLDNTGRTGVHEDGSGLIDVMSQALQLSGLQANQVDYINAHGTGTRLNDAAEARAVTGLFGAGARGIPCSSTKPVTGHCLGATPALEAVVCIEALRRQIVPPTANCAQPDPECAIDPQPLFARPAALATAMTNSLGFWGYHASLVFSRP